MMDLLRQELSRLNFHDASFQQSAFFMIFNPIFWNVIGRVEHRTGFVSKTLFGGNRMRSCYAFAAIVFILGLIRDYL